MFIQENFWPALGLTIFAGLATGVGSAMAFFAKRTSTRFLAGSMGFSAGVMIYVSFVEILKKSQTSLVSAYGPVKGAWATAGAFFAGIIFIGIIDKLIPSFENPHEMRSIEDMAEEPGTTNTKPLYRMGLFTALAIGIHNFPEGFATFASAMKDFKLGIPIAVAIAIHNIPEGIAVSIPIYYATGSKRKAFWLSLLSGLAEPIGALAGYFLFAKYMTDGAFGFLFGSVAGIMVFISLDELLPGAQKYGEHHLSIYGLIIGMAIMAISLLMFL